METILNEIERALEVGLFYLAVAMALTLPDICAALESNNGESEGGKYRAWYTTYLGQRYPRMTANDIWKLRSGVLHQGRCGHPQMQYGRVIFTIPNAQGGIAHNNNILNDALNLFAPRFCRDMMAAVRAWYAANQNNANVQTNLPNLVQFRPHGLAPYIVGVPVIA